MPPETAPPDAPPETLESAEPRNLFLLALYQVVIRTGWIFKTESVIIPAFLDVAVGGRSGWLRGCLPVLNRFGLSVPPLFYARRLESLPHKKWALASTSLTMSLPFFALASLWFLGLCRDDSWWLPPVFLALYTLFSSLNGMNLLTIGTLQGKLIRAHRRGRLLSVSTSAGTLTAVACAIWLLPGWLARPNGGFGYIFGFTAVCFAGSALCVLFLAEPADRHAGPRATLRGSFHDAMRLLQQDANLRRLAVVTSLFSTMVILFPHYQALGRTRLHASLGDLMQWVVVQNLGTGLGSMAAGPWADARGNRGVLGWLMLGTALTPLSAAVLAGSDSAWAEPCFVIVFFFVGLTPVTQRVMANYTLEICEPRDHARYLSTVNLCQAVPFLLAPLVGWLVDVAGFEAVFFAGAAVLGLAALMTRRLVEPRRSSPLS